MEDRISYGVFWRTKIDPDEWQLYAGWFDCFADAFEEGIKALQNPRSLKVRLVERTETYYARATWENDDE